MRINQRKQRALDAWAERNQQRFVEQAESNPWIHEWRRVKAEHDRTGDDKLFEDFERRFLEDKRKRYGPR